MNRKKWMVGMALSLGLAVTGATSVWAASPKAVRTIAGGRSGKVQIKVIPNSSVSAYALEERVPGGCQVSDVDNRGALDKRSNTIKWGVFFDKTPRTLSYKLSCSEGGAFAGMVSFNGHSVEIGGDKSLK